MDSRLIVSNPQIRNLYQIGQQFMRAGNLELGEGFVRLATWKSIHTILCWPMPLRIQAFIRIYESNN